jgi:signal transduction histidine kinase
LHEQAASADDSSELAALREQVEELRQAVRARDEFIAIAAHELRNPMTPLLGVADLALAAARAAGDPCPPRLILLLERMQLIVRDYVGRATRLLDVSRIKAGNLRLEPAAIDLSALVLSISQRYEVAASRGRSPLDLDIANAVCGVWDRLAAEQIADNLLSNALRFGVGQPVTIRLRSDERSVRPQVQDRGVGITPDQQARIFGRFEQVVSQRRGDGGFGIGLWVANQLVGAMGGGITVASRLGEGSTFAVTLPLTPADPDRTTYDAA